MKRIVLLLFAFIAACTTPAARQPTSITQVDVVINGSGASQPATETTPAVTDQHYDAIVVGGGLAGLTAAVYLTEKGKTVLLLDKEDHLGGLAAYSAESTNMMVDRGAAYFTDAYEEEQAILDYIGLGNYRDGLKIAEPIDSYLLHGKLYKGIWEDETLAELPASFDLFKFQLQRSDADKLIPNQPFEDFAKYGGKMDLDRYNTKQWIEKMPALMKQTLARLKATAEKTNPSDIKPDDKNDVEKDPIFAWAEAQRVWKRYQDELTAKKLRGPTGMQDVVELMDLYCRSALGNTSRYISAMAFANFYISEIVTRYTSPMGTGIAAFQMKNMLAKRDTLFKPVTGALVTRIVSGNKDAHVYYTKNGVSNVVTASYVVFSAQMRLAPQLIDGFKQHAPYQADLISKIGYADYLVHLVHLDGHPYRATYDTWLRSENYSDDDPTDVILGRWMSLKGYDGFRDFKADPPDNNGFLTIYHPLTQAWRANNGIYDDSLLKATARKAADRVVGLLNGLPPTLVHGPFNVTQIEVNRWPLSVHIAAPGYYSKIVPELRKPFGRVIFGNNNLGTPAFEEALFRGHCAAKNVLARLNPGAPNLEKWSRCTIE